MSAYAAERLYVRTPSDLPKSIVFVGREINGKFTPEGTGFLVGFSHRGFDFAYLVTADHVVNDIPGDVIAVRMNRITGNASCVTVPKNTGVKISRHEFDFDIAMFGIQVDGSIYDQIRIKLDREERDQVLKTFYSPAVGDEVVTTGLYSTHYGDVKNLPVVRVGHISLMPGEPVLSHRGYVTAYLIETKSIGGLSGSPVWLNVPPVMVKNNNVIHMQDAEQACVPIGMITGYHLVASEEDQIPVPRIQGMPTKGSRDATDNRNTGFAVVVPWEILLDIKDAMKKQIDDQVDEQIRTSGARPASVSGALKSSAPEASDADDNPNHLKDFTRLVDVAARKRPQGGRT